MPGGKHAAPISDLDEIRVWDLICAHAGEQFMTSGRGSKLGVAFTYEIKGGEMFVSARRKSITRSTILYAYRKVKDLEDHGQSILGPKTIGVHGDSYLYGIFKKLGFIQ